MFGRGTRDQRAWLRQQQASANGTAGLNGEAGRTSTLAVIPISRPCPIRVMPARHELLETRPIAASRNPCARCGTRGDLGCSHFAPFEPAPFPRSGAYELRDRPR